MPRPKIYTSNAEKQAAYRQRKRKRQPVYHWHKSEHRNNERGGVERVYFSFSSAAVMVIFSMNGSPSTGGS